MSLSELFVPDLSPLELIVRTAFGYFLVLVLFRVFGRSQQARHAGFDVAVLMRE